MAISPNLCSYRLFYDNSSKDYQDLELGSPCSNKDGHKAPSSGNILFLLLNSGSLFSEVVFICIQSHLIDRLICSVKVKLSEKGQGHFVNSVV